MTNTNNTISTNSNAALEVLKNAEPCSEYALDFFVDHIRFNYESDYGVDNYISEFADANTSIYYCDIMEFVKNHPDEVNKAAAEFGVDSRDFDIYKLGQEAEYLTIENDIYSAEEDIIHYACMWYAYMRGVDITKAENFEIIEAVAGELSFINSPSDIAYNISEAFELDIRNS